MSCKGRASSLLTACGGKAAGLGKWLQEEEIKEQGRDLDSLGNGRGQLVRRTNLSQKRETKRSEQLLQQQGFQETVAGKRLT